MPGYGCPEDQESQDRIELARKWCDFLWDSASDDDLEYIINAVIGAGFERVKTMDTEFMADLIEYGTQVLLHMVLVASEQGDTDFLASDYLAAEWLDYRLAEESVQVVLPALNDDRASGADIDGRTRAAIVFAAMAGGLRMIRECYDDGLTIADMLSIVVLGDE